MELAWNSKKWHVAPGMMDLCEKCTNRRGPKGCARKDQAAPTVQSEGGKGDIQLCSYFGPSARYAKTFGA